MVIPAQADQLSVTSLPVSLRFKVPVPQLYRTDPVNFRLSDSPFYGVSTPESPPFFFHHMLSLALLMTSLWLAFGPEVLCLLPFVLILLVKLSQS